MSQALFRLAALALIALTLQTPVLAEATSFQACSRFDYYTTEQEGHVFVQIPASARHDELGVRLFKDDAPCGEPVSVGGKSVVLVPVAVGHLSEGDHAFTCRLQEGAETVSEADLVLTKRPHKANAVKIDHLTGGLIVDDLPFIPFGFYCYSPVQPTLAEEEVVKGFNMMSPYQDNQPDTIEARRRYMDQCAALGMKVHYQLLSVAGGGGVHGADPKEAARKRTLLEAEIEAFRDHPALLAWYIADEPTGSKVPPEVLTDARAAIKHLDPYHPVTVVFMKPEAARDYQDSMDIVMTDVYPVPHLPITEVPKATELLVREFAFEKPVWYVPQAFGGSEWWKREPTAQEQRAMTYLTVVNGATAIQYFIRHGLNGFPKSTVMWGECSQLALEVAELTPALLSAEPRPVVQCTPDTVQAAGWLDRGVVTVLAVNAENAPAKMKLRLDGIQYKGTAGVLFENRSIDVARSFFKRDSVLTDVIDGFGTRAYRIPVNPEPDDESLIRKGNRTLNPSFEDTPSVGVPAGCYAGVGAGRGTTYFVDSRVARHGRHSLRIHVPAKDAGCSLSFFPTAIAENQPFRVSVWAKGAPSVAEHPAQFTLTFGSLGSETFALTPEWREYELKGVASQAFGRIGTGLTVQDPGTAWFDLLQVTAGRHAEEG